MSGIDEIFSTVAKDSGIRMAFDRQDRHGHQNTHTFYLRYQGPLPAENDVKVDITINETLGFPLVDRAVIRTYDAFADLPEEPTIRVYALEEIMVEKLVALTDKSRTEPRDLFDLAHLLDYTGIRFSDLQIEIETKLRFRSRSLSNLETALESKQPRLAKLWKSRLGYQVSTLPPFEALFRRVQRALREADFRNAGESSNPKDFRR